MQIQRPLSLFLLAASMISPLTAQGVNCQLLGTFNNHGPFNDVWGYTAPNGDEYALLLATTGTVVIDITDPANPVERGWFPWGASTWRDCRTYGSYAYVVTEATSGFQIIDLTNPNNPTLVGYFGTTVTSNAHNICIDTGTGRLYLVGTNAGTPAWDLSANPANPTFLGTASTANFHDLCVENGYAYGSHIGQGVLRIMDASSPFPWTVLSNTTTPSAFTHNAWPNASGTICVTTDERTGGVVKFYDITNKSNPIPLGQFTPNPASIPHNAFIVGDKCHVSWYTEGYRCIDISDPLNPVEIASYDTWPGASGGFSGCWGCYPFLPSGNILASDRSTGLYIVKPTSASFTNYGQGCPGSVSLPCPQLNPNGGTLTGSTNAYEYCYAVTSAGPLQVTGFDLWTQSTGGTVSRPAHIYADIGGSPASTPVASTTMQMGAQQGFYTASFASPVAVNGTFYVGMDSSSQTVVISTLSSGASGTGFYRTPATGNWSQSSLVQSPSWRVHCSGTGNAVPQLGNNGFPILGTSYDVTLSNAAAMAPTFFISGLSDSIYQGTPLPAPIPGAPGCSVYAAPHSTLLMFTSAAGTASASTTVPNAPFLSGLSVYHQWAILDSVNATGIVVSDAGRAVVDS